MLFQQATFTKLMLICVLIAVLAQTLAQWVLSFKLNFNKQEDFRRSAFEAGLFFCVTSRVMYFPSLCCLGPFLAQILVRVQFMVVGFVQLRAYLRLPRRICLLPGGPARRSREKPALRSACFTVPLLQ